VWSWSGGEQRAVIELKILRGDAAKLLAKGLEQTLAYQDRSRASEAHLVIFDRDPGKPWDAKIYRRAEELAGRRVVVWGM
jgi:hypothetical protein